MPASQKRAQELKDLGWGYKRIAKELGSTPGTIRKLLGAQPGRAPAHARTRGKPGEQDYEGFLESELAEAMSDRKWIRSRAQGQAIESNRRSIRDIRKELEGVREAKRSAGGVYDVEAFLEHLCDVPDELWDEAVRRRAEQ